MTRWRDKPQAEQQADLKRYRAAKKAANNAARRFGAENAATRQLNSAVI